MRVRAGFVAFLASFSVIAACGRPAEEQAAPVRAEVPRPEAASAAAGADSRRDAPRIIFLGDSLTAGLGLAVDKSFPSIIQKRLDTEGREFVVVNAGVSGDTSAGGLRRLEWALSEGDPRVLVLALGGNDGLRGLPPEQLEENLAAIIERAQARGLQVILAGMEAPPNFGADYTSRFREVYPSLARRYDVPLIPFLLDGVAGTRELNQSDGIHPNERGAAVVAELVWRTLEPTLDRVRPTATP